MWLFRNAFPVYAFSYNYVVYLKYSDMPFRNYKVPISLDDEAQHLFIRKSHDQRQIERNINCHISTLDPFEDPESKQEGVLPVVVSNWSDSKYSLI